MRTIALFRWPLMVVVAACSLLTPERLGAAETPVKPSRPAIYDTKADGAKQIDMALATARRENKRVLLQFGANWCGWCHLLHQLFQTNQEIARMLSSSYVVVLIDVDKVDDKPHNADINTRYGDPTTHGLPVIVILDAEGKKLHTQDTGLLENGPRHDPAKVMAFLEKWRPPK